MGRDNERTLVLEVATISEVDLTPVAPATEGDLIRLGHFALDAEKARGEWEAAFVLVDDARLQQFHIEYMGIVEPTDVMTFERDPDDGEPGHPVHGGDIIISVDRVVEQAMINGNTPGRELLFVAVHGLLHLTGWVDHSADERTAMLARGEDLLTRFEALKTVASKAPG